MPIVIPRPPFDTGVDVVLGDARAIELNAQRDITHAFITAQPIELILTPHTRSRTATGGWVSLAGTARAAQIFRIITMSENVQPVQALDGVERKVDFMLLGEWDAVVAAGDTFTYDGGAYEVIELMPDIQYETRALVTRHGR